MHEHLGYHGCTGDKAAQHADLLLAASDTCGLDVARHKKTLNPRFAEQIKMFGFDIRILMSRGYENADVQ